MAPQVSSLTWSDWQFFSRGDDFFSDLISTIRRAKKSITIEVYIFEIDPLTRIILQELEQAVRRGCQVFILVDGFGSYFWLNTLEKECQKKKIRFRVFQPLPRSYGWFKTFLVPYLFRLFKLLRKLNHRNHRKIFIIDEEIAFLGSLNLTQVHSEKLMGSESWQDLGVRLSGGSLSDLSKAFWVSWTKAPKIGFKNLFRRRIKDRHYNWKNSLVRLNTTAWSRYRLYRDLIKRIKKSEKKICIASAYFLPKRSALRALQKASERGIDIQVIIPSRTDVPMVKWAAAGLIEKLTQSGVKVYEYVPRVFHSKYTIIDDWAAMGSHNWNHRSFMHDLEVEAVFTDSAAIEQINSIWALDKEQSFRLTAEEIKSKNWIRRLLSKIAFRLRYLL